MKLATRSHPARGGALLGMLIIMVVVGTTLGSYLTLVYNQNYSTVRSQGWNSAIPVAEAGVEEALTHLHYHPTNLESQGWSLAGTNYFKERFLGSNKFQVFISTSAPPIILSRGLVPIRFGPKFSENPRTLMIITTNDSLFSKAMVAKGAIDLRGNSIRTDSFDSSNTNYSTGGRYDPAKAKANGDIATNSGMVDSLDVWNTEIYGRASTGPGGTIHIGPNGSVGDKAWHDAGNKGLQPGWSNDDMNVDFPELVAPFTGGAFGPPSGTLDGVSYRYVLGSGNFQLGGITLSGQEQMIVTGNAILYVNGDISMSGQSSITIAPGGSLTIYADGASTSFGGSGVVNQAGGALSFMYYGLENNKSITLAGNSSFTGAIYAPYAALTMSGGGGSSNGFVGACVTASLQLSGNFEVHYDEALASFGPRRGYTVIAWSEVN